VLQTGARNAADSHTAVGDPNNPHNITLEHWGVKLLTNIANEAGTGANTVQSGPGRIKPSSNVFQIWGYTEFAGEGLYDSLSFHNNGRRIGNNDTADLGSGAGWNYNPTTVYDGITWSAQQPYVTSIGGWAPSNNQIIDTGTGGINEKWLYGEHNWDGDLAEVLVFNEKLSNVQMALVEGYLAHKYGFQDDLIHKDGTIAAPAFDGLDHPYRYDPPPAVGANTANVYLL
jgi:hypothetical protein